MDLRLSHRYRWKMSKGIDSDDGHEDEDVDSDFDQLSLSTLSSPLLSTEQTASSKIASRTVE